MCIDALSKNEYQKTRSGGYVLVTKIDRSGKVTAKVLKTSPKTAKEFPYGSEVTYQSPMGHVLCKGQGEDGELLEDDQCELHPMDAVAFVGIKGDLDTEAEQLLTPLLKEASLKNPNGHSPFGPRETERILARRQKFVDALNSGVFKQTQRELHDTEGAHCVMGVAHELNPKLTVDSEQIVEDDLRYFGMDDEQQWKLMNLNDNGRSFKTIAKVIEKLPLVRIED